MHFGMYIVPTIAGKGPVLACISGRYIVTRSVLILLKLFSECYGHITESASSFFSFLSLDSVLESPDSREFI